MSKTQNSNAALYWVIAVVVASMVVFVYLFISDAPKSLPKIKLSYFTDEKEVSNSVSKRLFQEINQSSFYWVGIEPEKDEQLGVVLKLKEELDLLKHFSVVIADQEINLKPEMLKALGVTEQILVKEQWSELGTRLAELEKSNTSYFLITAAIYSTSLLPQNTLHKIKEKFQIKPITFSFGYFATSPEEENKLTFKCNTEDSSGTKEWGCFVINKARAARRKLEVNNPKPWLGLMDLTGEADYAILLKKK